jgi:hypothetical protein
VAALDGPEHGRDLTVSRPAGGRSARRPRSRRGRPTAAGAGWPP